MDSEHNAMEPVAGRQTRRSGVDINEEYFLFQTLVGAWPLQMKSEIESFVIA